jgi:hypothetical protein
VLYATVVLAISAVALVFVLVRMTLTLNEISVSLKKISRQKSEARLAARTALVREEKAPAIEEEKEDESELAAVVALARAVADGAIKLG